MQVQIEGKNYWLQMVSPHKIQTLSELRAMIQKKVERDLCRAVKIGEILKLDGNDVIVLRDNTDASALRTGDKLRISTKN